MNNGKSESLENLNNILGAEHEHFSSVSNMPAIDTSSKSQEVPCSSELLNGNIKSLVSHPEVQVTPRRSLRRSSRTSSIDQSSPTKRNWSLSSDDSSNVSNDLSPNIQSNGFESSLTGASGVTVQNGLKTSTAHRR